MVVLCSVSKSGISERAFFVFSSLAPHALPALLDTALSVITPVTRGMARPVDPLSMADRHKVREQQTTLLMYYTVSECVVTHMPCHLLCSVPSSYDVLYTVASLQVTEEMFRLPPVSLLREHPMEDMEQSESIV